MAKNIDERFTEEFKRQLEEEDSLLNEYVKDGEGKELYLIERSYLKGRSIVPFDLLEDGRSKVYLCLTELKQLRSLSEKFVLPEGSFNTLVNIYFHSRFSYLSIYSNIRVEDFISSSTDQLKDFIEYMGRVSTGEVQLDKIIFKGNVSDERGVKFKDDIIIESNQVLKYISSVFSQLSKNGDSLPWNFTYPFTHKFNEPLDRGGKHKITYYEHKIILSTLKYIKIEFGVKLKSEAQVKALTGRLCLLSEVLDNSIIYTDRNLEDKINKVLR